MVGSRDTAVTFRWGGDMAECACAHCFGCSRHFMRSYYSLRG
jgi:hypothetical protein